MSEKIILTKEELAELLKLYRTSQDMPVMALSVADGLAGRDFASVARRRFEDYWAELGRKYGFNPGTNGFNSETGEVTS